MGTVEAPAIERAVSLKQNLGERGMIHNVGVSPGLMDKGAATGPYSSEIGGEGRAYVDALVHTNPPKIWEAKFYSWTNFQKTFQSLWISGKKGGHEIQKLLRDGELYAATDDVFNAENRVLYVRADVWKEITRTQARLDKITGGFEKIGWTLKPLPEIDVPQAGRALGVAGVA